jgi:hypothetical protein
MPVRHAVPTRQKNPEPVRVHDFLIPQKGKSIPYGVCDLTRKRVG